MSMLSLIEVTKRFALAAALDRVSLEIAEGELLALLGPSGCGKTSLLRAVAGFLRPDQGAVLIRGRDVTSSPPEQRNLGMVFQSYSLWPHLTVAENVAFGLRARRWAPSAVRRRVTECLGLVRLDALAARLPRELSGGQQQRVALARALAYEPDLLLLDEPFSALDRRLRDDLQREVRALQRRLGVTALFVTHDQDEAMRMADRIAIMNLGRIEQLDTPTELYRVPRSAFAAGFLGETATLEGEVDEVAGVTCFTSADGLVVKLPDIVARGCARLLLRPEQVRLVTPEAAERRCTGAVTEVSFEGATSRVTISVAGGGELVARVMGRPPPPGTAVGLAWADDAFFVLPV